MKSIPYKFIISSVAVLMLPSLFTLTYCDDQIYSTIKKENTYHYKNRPAIDERFFPNTEFEDTLGSDGIVNLTASINTNEKYWTSTRFVFLGFDSFYAISFDDGFSRAYSKESIFFIRCVSGTAPVEPHITAFPVPDTGQDKSFTQVFGEDHDYLTPASMQYTDNGDGTILDNVSGLTWTKCTMGDNADTSPDCTGFHNKYIYNDAISACTNLSLAGKSWHLPTLPEILSIIHFGNKRILVLE